MKQKRRRGKRIKVWLWILSGIFITIAALFIYLRIHVDDIAGLYLDRLLEKKPLKGHVISYDKVSLRFPDLSVIISNVNIHPDSSSILIKDPDSLAYQNLYNISCDRLAIMGLSFWKYVKDSTLDIRRIKLESPDLSITLASKRRPKNTEEELDQGNPNDSLTIPGNSAPDLIKLGKFEIVHARLSISKAGDKEPVISVKDYNFTLRGAELDLGYLEKYGKMSDLHLDKMDAQIDARGIDYPGRLYDASIENFQMDLSSSTLSIQNLIVKPKYGPVEFAKLVGVQTDRFDLTARTINISGIMWLDMIEKNSILASQIEADHLNLSVFRDKNIPRDMSIFPVFPQEALRKLTWLIDIDSIIVTNSNLEYLEKAKGAAIAGRVVLGGLNARIYDLTNDPEFVNTNQDISVEADFNFMGSGKSKVFLSFFMGSPLDDFAFGGKMAYMDLRKMNAILPSNVGIEIGEGKNQLIKFNGWGNSDSAWGVFHFKYDDLDLKVLKKDELRGGQESKFLSFIANTIARKSNPPGDKPERIANMFFLRDPNKGIINLMVKALFDGAYTIVGPDNTKIIKDDPPKAKKQEENRLKRGDRRAVRKEKRARNKKERH